MHCPNGCDVSNDRVMREHATQVLRCGACGERVHESNKPVDGCPRCRVEQAHSKLRHDGNTVLL